MFNAATSRIAREVDSAMWAIVLIDLVLLVGITAAMLYFVVRYRRSRSATTKQVEGHMLLEVTWTVIPTVLVIGMFFIGYKGFALMRSPPRDAMEVSVLGQQWFWTFTYPDTGVTSPEMYVPVNTPVKVRINAALTDVLHSFYIPAFRIKEDAVPGQETFLWFQAEERGTYNIFCAEFCGKDHSRMLSKLHVVSKDAFNKWMADQAAERFRPVDIVAALDPKSAELKGYDGRQLFGRYCAACHGPGGEGGGPYKARDLRTVKGWKRGTKLTDILTTISAGLDGTQMRSFRHLPIRERLALTHHAASFLTEGVRPPVADADIAALKLRFPETDPASRKGVDTTRPEIPIEEAMKKVVEEGR